MTINHSLLQIKSGSNISDIVLFSRPKCVTESLFSPHHSLSFIARLIHLTAIRSPTIPLISLSVSLSLILSLSLCLSLSLAHSRSSSLSLSGESARTQVYVVRVYFLRGIDLIPPPSSGVHRSINPYLIVSLGAQQLR